MAVNNFARFMALQNSNISENTSNSAGEIVEGKTFIVNAAKKTAQKGAEIFNDYNGNIAIGKYSHSEGFGNKALEEYSHSEGYRNESSGWGSHAEGRLCIAEGRASHAEEEENGAYEYCSHSEGYRTFATAFCAHVEGNYATASGDNAHAEGYHTIAAGKNSHVQGRYNVEDTENKFAFIIGNGENSSTRSNAFAINWEGNVYVENSTTAVNVLDLLNRITALEARVAALEGGV